MLTMFALRHTPGILKNQKYPCDKINHVQAQEIEMHILFACLYIFHKLVERICSKINTSYL